MVSVGDNATSHVVPQRPGIPGFLSLGRHLTNVSHVVLFFVIHILFLLPHNDVNCGYLA